MAQAKNKIFLRQLKEEDIEVVANTFCFPWSTLPKTTSLWKSYFEEQQKGVRTVVLMEWKGEPVGYGNLFREPHYSHFREERIPEINNVWVAKECREKGFGRMLLLHLEELARKEGYKKIGLGVGLYRDYGAAQKLYFQLGYKPDGRGVTYKCESVIPGEKYPIDDDLILWLTKSL